MARRSMTFTGALGYAVRLEQMEGALVMPTIAYFAGLLSECFSVAIRYPIFAA